MLVEIRIYRRHDADLIFLAERGVSITKMMRLALENYVAGERIKFRIPPATPLDLTYKTMYRYRLNVKDPDAIRLLRSIKNGYRNQFCKALLRDMLDAEPLCVFMEQPDALDTENSRLEGSSLVADAVIGSVKKREKMTRDLPVTQRETAAVEKTEHIRKRAEDKERRDRDAVQKEISKKKEQIRLEEHRRKTDLDEVVRSMRADMEGDTAERPADAAPARTGSEYVNREMRTEQPHHTDAAEESIFSGLQLDIPEERPPRNEAADAERRNQELFSQFLSLAGSDS